MIPKEKAKELVDKFRMNVLDYEQSGLNTFKAKQCALIAVDEILELICCMDGKEHWQEFYEQVKHEIEKL